jgi:uncharacterized protein
MSEFGAYQPAPPRFKGEVSRSYYVRMRDGVKIAVQVTLPASLEPGERIPAVLSQTRYWRAVELNWPFSRLIRPQWLNWEFRDYAPFFTGQGYALVSVDVRGTGASFGTWTAPWDAASVTDAGEIVDWLTAQPWCNGKIAGAGVSYMGTTAELLAAAQRPAVKAVLPAFNHPDAYNDIAFPGGIFNHRFITAWGDMDRALDHNVQPAWIAGLMGTLLLKGVKPVDGDTDRGLLRAAIAAHATNGDIFRRAHEVICRE